MIFLIIILVVVSITTLIMSYYFFREGKAEIKESKKSKRSESENAGIKKQSYKVFGLTLLLSVLSIITLAVVIWLLLII